MLSNRHKEIKTSLAVFSEILVAMQTGKVEFLQNFFDLLDFCSHGLKTSDSSHLILKNDDVDWQINAVTSCCITIVLSVERYLHIPVMYLYSTILNKNLLFINYYYNFE